MRPDTRGGWAEHAYRVLLLAFPASTRRMAGDEMAAHFSDELRLLAGRPIACAGLWVRALGDAIRHGVADRLGRRLPVSRHSARRRSPPAMGPAGRRRSPGIAMTHHVIAVVSWSYRSLRSTPLVTTLAVLSLALGIGANTAVFSIVNSLLLKPMPVRNPEALLLLEGGSWTYPIWEQVRQRQRELFDGAFAWSAGRFDRTGGGETQFIELAYVSGEMFAVLGLTPLRGRLLGPDDDVIGGGAGGPAAVISHRFWHQEFGGVEGVPGRTLLLGRVPFTVVGVLPPEFTGPTVGQAVDVFVPFAAEPLVHGRASSLLTARSTWWLDIMVRARPGQSVNQANAALRAAQPQIRAATIPESYSPVMQEVYLREPFTLVQAPTGQSPGSARVPLLAMLAVVGLVLLIACVNVANLLTARALARRREVGVRLALGGSRLQVAALLFGESLLLALTGAGIGLIVAQWAGPLLVSQLDTWQQTVTLNLTPDWRVLGFTAAVSLVTAILAGLAPAWSARRVPPAEILGSAGRTVLGSRTLGARGVLIAAQVALSLVLLVGAGLFLRTFTALAHAPLGFEAERLLVADLDFAQSGIAPRDRPAVMARLRDAAASLPGVLSAASGFVVPTSGRGWNSAVGTTPVPDRSRMTWMDAVSPGWFRTYGTPLVAGRDFDAGDVRGAELVAIVNQSFARRFVEGPPIGQTVQIGGPGGPYTPYRIVGLAADALYRSPREGMAPTMYVALSQREPGFQNLALTVALAPGTRMSVRPDLAAAIRAVAPDASFTFRTFDELVAGTIVRERLIAILSTFFGVLALLLAGIGLYGVMSHGVSQRRAELGVRIALGARPTGIIALIARRFGLAVLAGMAVGLVLSLWAGPFIDALLFDVEPNDPWTLGGAVIVLTIVAGVAACVPARRAIRLDPAEVLREG